ncbi:MAG: hypothetical protein Q4E62_03950 [Sutterellaceae bacterium]|nr:hypothetical protein [Sutterellaceae bacterium]
MIGYGFVDGLVIEESLNRLSNACITFGPPEDYQSIIGSTHLFKVVGISCDTASIVCQFSPLLEMKPLQSSEGYALELGDIFLRLIDGVSGTLVLNTLLAFASGHKEGCAVRLDFNLNHTHLDIYELKAYVEKTLKHLLIDAEIQSYEWLEEPAEGVLSLSVVKSPSIIDSNLLD